MSQVTSTVIETRQGYYWTCTVKKVTLAEPDKYGARKTLGELEQTIGGNTKTRDEAWCELLAARRNLTGEEPVKEAPKP